MATHHPLDSHSAHMSVWLAGSQKYAMRMMSGTPLAKAAASKPSKHRSTTQRACQAGIQYSSHVSYVGWQDWSKRATYLTRRGNSAPSKQSASYYRQTCHYDDIWYRGYSQYVRWMGWAKNGQPAGSTGAYRQLEALEVRLVPKAYTQLARWSLL